MANTISVLFWVRRTKVNKDGLVPLMIRLTYQNEQSNKATGYFVKVKNWNNKLHLLKGKDTDTEILNEWIKASIGKSGECDHLFPVEADHPNPEQTDQANPVQIDHPLSCI